jgi:hypothetical protein
VEPILIGYFPKRSAVPTDWTSNPAVKELCSVSECLAAGPPDWIQAWQHNALGRFDSPGIARGLVPPASMDRYRIYGYRLWPRRWVEGQAEAFTPPPIAVTPLPPSFERLGVDVVSSSTGSGFECSPLSCNHLAAEVPVNQYCLLDTMAEALDLAARAESIGAEPGPYYVVEVWRERTIRQDT